MSTVGSRIKNRREELQLSQEALAKKLGYKSRSSINKIELDQRNLTQSKIKAIADALETTPSYIMGWDEPSKVAETPAMLIPVLGLIPAGIPIEAIEDIVDWEEIPAAMCSGGREYFGLRVRGDSMYPEYMEGDTIIVRKTQAFESGDVCVVYVNGYDATLKRVKVGEDGSWALIPRNPEYTTKTYSVQDVQTVPVSIAGVVVELRRKVR